MTAPPPDHLTPDARTAPAPAAPAPATSGRSLARQGAASFTDQVIMSATNFLTGVVLARWAPPETYGVYALAFAVLLALQMIQNALVTGPLTILGSPLEGGALRRFVSALAAAQLALAALTSVVLALLAGAALVLSADHELARAFAALAVAAFFIETQEFVRRLLFSRLLPGKVLLNDVFYCGLQVSAVALLWWLDRRSGTPGAWLNARNVFVAMSGSALVGSLLGLAQARGILLLRREPEWRSLLAEAWRMGRYSLGGLAGQMMFVLANRVAAAFAGGMAGVAMLEAPRLLVAPLHVIGASAGNLTVPRATRAHARGGRPALLRFLLPVAAVWALAYAAYATVIAVAPSFWLRLFYGQKYAGAEVILVLWCATHALIGLRVLPGSSLKVTRHYGAVMWSTLAGGIVVVVATAALATFWGVTGAALGRLVGEAVLIAALFFSFARAVRAPRGSAVPPSPERADVEGVA